METLLETFCVLNGDVLDVHYHALRLERSLGHGRGIAPLVEAVRAEVTKAGTPSGRWRASVVYSARGVESVRLVPYEVPKIKSLRLVRIDANFYSKKWADRSKLDSYKRQLQQGEEPLFVLSGGLTDTTFTNIALERCGALYTPDVPLLAGTKRAKLLETGAIRTAAITVESLAAYDRIHLINAMLDPGEAVVPATAVR